MLGQTLKKNIGMFGENNEEFFFIFKEEYWEMLK